MKQAIPRVVTSTPKICRRKSDRSSQRVSFTAPRESEVVESSVCRRRGLELSRSRFSRRSPTKPIHLAPNPPLREQPPPPRTEEGRRGFVLEQKSDKYAAICRRMEAKCSLPLSPRILGPLLDRSTPYPTCHGRSPWRDGGRRAKGDS